MPFKLKNFGLEDWSSAFSSATMRGSSAEVAIFVMAEAKRKFCSVTSVSGLTASRTFTTKDNQSTGFIEERLIFPCMYFLSLWVCWNTPKIPCENFKRLPFCTRTTHAFAENMPMKLRDPIFRWLLLLVQLMKVRDANVIITTPLETRPRSVPTDNGVPLSECACFLVEVVLLQHWHRT